MDRRSYKSVQHHLPPHRAPFTFARLNNEARKYCQGSHLLFLNNDIEFCSNNVLDLLMDPFAHPDTSAVGAKLLYPDGSIQHQGVVIVKENDVVFSTGKNLKQLEVVNSLIPLTTPGRIFSCFSSLPNR